MMLLSRPTQTPIDQVSLKKLQQKIGLLEKKIISNQKDLAIAAMNMKKISEMLAEISVVQKVHVEQTATLQTEIDTLVAVLFPKEDIKFDLMNEPYN